MSDVIRAAALVLLLAMPAAAQTAQETALFEVAQASGQPADFLAYLARYPDGVFAEAARFELRMAGIDPPSPPQTDITFTTPLADGEEGVRGQSIADLLRGTPRYPPIEGLPETLWKDQPCATCHQWTAADLCEQGRTLNRPEMAARMDLPHPYGAAFKRALRSFAAGGCRTE
jgi:hypothetical protein